VIPDLHPPQTGPHEEPFSLYISIKKELGLRVKTFLPTMNPTDFTVFNVEESPFRREVIDLYNPRFTEV